MSLTYTQVVSQIRKRTGNTTTDDYSASDLTTDINLAYDRVLSLIFKADGRWQFDDSNQTDYPIITTNLVSGQRDYSFTTDENGNLVLDIYKVMIKDANGVYVELLPVDQQSRDSIENPIMSMVDGRDLTGQPNKYDKSANSIFLDVIPNYNSTGGLKIWINREPSYFTTSDTTKKAGFAGIFHEYLVVRPAWIYATDHNLNNVNALRDEMLLLEKEIENYYGSRNKDERLIITSQSVNPY